MPMEFPEPGSQTNLNAVLRRRGHRIENTGKSTNTLFPSESWNKVLTHSHGNSDYSRYFHPEPISPYMKIFAKRSFRKMVKILIENQPNPVTIQRLRAVCGDSITEYLELLRRLVLIEENDSGVILTRPLKNLGPSLEHYVAELMESEFSGSAAWGAILKDLPIAGGDYDVLAWLDPSLVYIECKTSDPRNITTKHIDHFMRRSIELAPELAIFLVDTDDSVEELLSAKFMPTIEAAEVDGSNYFLPDDPGIITHAGYSGIYQVFFHPCVYVTGPNPSIEMQLSRCLKHYYAHVRGLPFYYADFKWHQ